jgi:hypothetical protein
MKTVYSQELDKITKSKKSVVETNEMYEPKVVWFDVLG